MVSTDDLDWTQVGAPWDVIPDTPLLSFEEVRPALGAHGILVSVRGLPARLGDATAMVRRKGLRFAAVRTAAHGLGLAFLSRLIDSGELRIPIDRVFPAGGIQDAHRHAEGPEVRGKVVVSVLDLD